tara:strand:- start:48 stop:260 length:213 start_codon:yes stop_codon:yes gene_type:complete
MKIIYQEADGSVAVITPAPNCSLTDAQTALKDVPTGLKFKIVADDVVPSDRTFRNAWAVDEATLTDGVGA